MKPNHFRDYIIVRGTKLVLTFKTSKEYREFISITSRLNIGENKSGWFEVYNVERFRHMFTLFDIIVERIKQPEK